MIKLNRGFRLLCRSIIIALLVSYIWISSLPTPKALAMPYPLIAADAHQDTHLTKEDSNISKARVKRIDAIAECKQYLAKGDNASNANLDRPLDKMGNDRLVGALKASDKAEPTEAEVAFKRCLEEKGIAPTPQQSDRKNRAGEGVL